MSELELKLDDGELEDYKLLEEARRLAVAIYTAFGKCVELTQPLKPKDQIAAMMGIIRELTLKVDDMVMEELEVILHER